MHFFIEYFKNNISIHEYVDNKRCVLKYMGEDTQRFDYEKFWDWWRKKVEYQQEEVMFIIFTDKETFDVPENINILPIKNINQSKKDDLSSIPSLPTNAKMITKPENLDLNVGFSKKIKRNLKTKSPTISPYIDYNIKESHRFKSDINSTH